MWILYAAASAVFAGVTTIFLKKGVHTTNTNAALALRTIVICFLHYYSFNNRLTKSDIYY